MEASGFNNSNHSDPSPDFSNSAYPAEDSTSTVNSPRTDTSTLSGIEALSRQPSTTDTLRDSPTQLDQLQATNLTGGIHEQTEAPSDATDLNAAIAAIAGATGREQAVQGILDRAYQAGLNSPQSAYDGPMHRGVSTPYADGSLGYAHSTNPQRYNGPGQHTLYGAPTQAGAIHELSVYPDSVSRTYTEFALSVNPDPHTGTGGVADVSAGLASQNLPDAALTQHTRNPISRALHLATGEHPYHAPQQTAKGALDAGAAAILTPSSVGGSQLNVLPANADPASITPVSRQTLSPSGVLGPVESAATVANMPAYGPRPTTGAFDMPAGGTGTQPRASSIRYGAAGAVGDTLVQTGINALSGQPVNAGQFGQDLAVNTTVGAVAARATDALTPRLGNLRAGGAVGGVIQAGFSGYTNHQAYSAGEISGERAIANTVVDTGTAIAAGATGAAAGAFVGSVVPVAGTAVGAVAGFAVGVGAHYAIQAVDSVTGFTSAAKDLLTSGLESATNWISSWW